MPGTGLQHQCCSLLSVSVIVVTSKLCIFVKKGCYMLMIAHLTLDVPTGDCAVILIAATLHEWRSPKQLLQCNNMLAQSVVASTEVVRERLRLVESRVYLSAHTPWLQPNSPQIESWVRDTRAQSCCSCRVVVIWPSHANTHSLKHDAIQRHGIGCLLDCKAQSRYATPSCKLSSL